MSTRNLTIYFTAILALLLTTSCVPTLPVIKDDTIPIPGTFPETPSSPATTSSGIQSWKDFFKDPRLSALIENALKNNQELHIFEQEINIADNEVMARQGEYLPKVGVGAGYDMEKVGKNTSQGVSDAANGVPKYLQIGRVGLITTWEVDIWGKLRNAAKSAYYHYLSSIEGKNFLVTQLVAEIANVYFELMALDNQLEIVNSYIDILKKITSMVELQQSAARVTLLPVMRFKAETLKNEARQVQIQQQIIMTRNRLNTLVGRFPQDFERDSKQFMSINLPKIDTGIPSSLLDNRPDIRSAALELESSKLSVKSARSRFFPSLSIEAGVGYESFNSQHFISADSLFYNLAGNLTAPLLNRANIKAAYYSANNKQIQAVYHYEQTLVKAFAEVVNQLNMIKNLNQVYDLKSKQVSALNESITISNMLFRAARVDYVEALFTRRDALESQVELIEVKKQQLSAYVNLYKALGGGWRTVEEAKAGAGGTSG